MRFCFFKALLLLVTVAMTGLATAQSADDERAIRNLAQQYETGWNTHDMNLLGAMRTDDIDFVVVTGEHRKGREASMAPLGEQHRTQFRDSVWTNEKVSVQFIRPDVALVHIDWGIKGDRNTDDTPRPPRRGTFTWVVVKDGGAWALRAAHNTNKQR
jgi:uncharacterized protein (TIGR02246 family)